MSFGFSNVKGSLLCFIAAIGAVSCAQAQQAGQPIIFSSPESAVTSSTSDNSPKRPKIVDPVQVPSSGFNFSQPSAPLLPPSTIRPPEKRKNQQDLNNWVFMTPAEILGVSTPEKMMGIQEHDAAGNPVNLTPQERYMDRLNQARTAYTNNYSSSDTTFWKPGDQNNQSVWDPPNSPNDNAAGNSSALLNRFSGPDNSVWSDNQNDNSSWSRLTGSFKQLTDTRPAQNSTMDQFRELLNPTPAPTPVSKPAVSSGFDTGQSFGFGQPVANPIGGSAAPLSSGVGLPTVLPTLPTITSQQTPQPSLTPTWKTRMSQTPDFTIPQRKF